MARQAGLIPTNISYEVKNKGPFDARMLVPTKADLTLESNWSWQKMYRGMIVSVSSDENEENNGLYILKGDVDSGDGYAYLEESSWVKLMDNDDFEEFEQTIKEQLDNYVAEMSITKMVIGELPDTGEDNTIYFRELDGNWEEYIWYNNQFIMIGSNAGDLSNYYTKDEIDTKIDEITERIDSLCVYNLGNFDTLDEASNSLCYHGVYNNPDRRIIMFTVANYDTAIVINNVGNMEETDLGYITKQYLYFQERKYYRTITRPDSGIIYNMPWIPDDGNILQGKEIQFKALADLTTDATDAEIQAALLPITTTSSDSPVTAEDLENCITTGTMLKDAYSGTPVIVSKSGTTPHYILTYTGILNANSITSSEIELQYPSVYSVAIDIIDGVYSIYKAADEAEMVREDWEELPFDVRIPFVYSSTAPSTVYSESTILGWFGCTTVDELKEKARNTKLMSLIYINSGDLIYHIPVQFIEFRNDDTQLYIVTEGLSMIDDEPCRYIITINLDGTLISETSNASIVRDKLLRESNVKTINGESIIGTGDIVITGSGTLSPATTTSLGGVLATDVESDEGNTYYVGVESDGKAYVKVPTYTEEDIVNIVRDNIDIINGNLD